jgi:hypothetical protein
MLEIPSECWAHCPKCRIDFRLGCSVPCALSVYVAVIKLARCPSCDRHKGVMVYSPGAQPPFHKDNKVWTLTFGT